MEGLIVNGFSRLSKEDRINWLVKNFTNNSLKTKEILSQYWLDNKELQKLHDEFSENTISNFFLPWGIAPNFLIDGEMYALPMVTEESSVVAAAANAAKFWLNKGGFSTQVLGTTKLGHIHFFYKGNKEKFTNWFQNFLKIKLEDATAEITQNMRSRGGGITSIILQDNTAKLEGYYFIEVSFDTRDSMGANFINSCLEEMTKILKEEMNQSESFQSNEKESLQITMSILSNYVPDCRVRAEVCCEVDELDVKVMSPYEFAVKFKQAIDIATVETFRATTHNKGIMNGIDAVVIATGNDFRAVESCAHTYASRSGKYRGLTNCIIEDNIFRFWLEIPLALGVVGGLTKLHPLVRASLEILKKPTSEKLMKIVAVSGLAQNFAAIRSLITTGIQKGHMKMHLLNILNQLGATNSEKELLSNLFKDQIVSHHRVVKEFNKLRRNS
ncbi:hydroxymethylglutaryl-CoA reductase, degradative [Apibacter muscae]|uniref:3-hydroxy-3-methylglutaryl coenzyme A reductase n=1 Tax=Apibacter muscae TaxID=2509004 RepID=A0A563DKI7_9FLAO|nr:hydroxymethylglutaryl-CoA reductase, degradative [Apibacter muscae]TWP30687.1 hydroxymethylglutaryl-CoA reductase, degradative [Apibacter muscae]